MADGLDLAKRVRPRQELRTSLEKPPEEVGAQAVAQDRDVQLVDNPCQLAHVVGREELGLVNEDTRDR